MDNLLVIVSSFPDKNNTRTINIFVKEQLKSLSKYFKKIYILSPTSLGRKLRDHNRAFYKDYSFKNIYVYFPTYINTPYLKLLRKIWLYFEKKSIKKTIEKHAMKFDLIHAHYTWPSGAVSIKLKKEFNVPVVITEHTSLTFRRVIEKKDKLYLNTWNYCDAIIRVRRKDIKDILNLGIPVNKVYHIPNGFDPSLFYPLSQKNLRKKLNLPENKKIILNVANLYAVKGHVVLLEAIKEILKERKDIFCVIIGAGPLRRNLRNEIRRLGLKEYVALVGANPHEVIPLWMNACDVFVLPSLSEGNPTVMFECLGCGVPFVGTRVGGIPEIITSENYGLLVEPANPKDLAEKILIALKKEWDHRKIVEYSKKFTWEEISKKILDVYEEVLR